MLDVTALDFDYQDQPLIANVNFHLPKGGLLHLKGKNGAGKTTMLKLIAGLYQPSQGQILFDQEPINTDLSRYQKQLCYIGHKTGISPYLTVKENCHFDLHHANNSLDLKTLCAIFKLESLQDKLCGQLSAGQRRQVGLLRLWMTKARLWLLDEPLVALDDSSLSTLMTQIEGHRKQGGAVILSSHQPLPLHASDYLEFSL